MRLLLLLVCAACLQADGPGVLLSKFSKNDAAPTADPNSAFWKGAGVVTAAKGPRGEAVDLPPTEIRARWTKQNLYFLFICPYNELYLKPTLTTKEETNKLWEYDVAEIFIGADFKNINQYKELQVSPRGEWVDLDIDRDHPKPEGGWMWNSGFQHAARLDEKKKIWYGEFRIPFEKIDTRRPLPGVELRLNLYRIQGPGPNRTHIAWQPTGQGSYHVPEAFGRLRLEK